MREYIKQTNKFKRRWNIEMSAERGSRRRPKSPLNDLIPHSAAWSSLGIACCIKYWRQRALHSMKRLRSYLISLLLKSSLHKRACPLQMRYCREWRSQEACFYRRAWATEIPTPKKTWCHSRNRGSSAPREWKHHWSRKPEDWLLLCLRSILCRRSFVHQHNSSPHMEEDHGKQRQIFVWIDAR